MTEHDRDRYEQMTAAYNFIQASKQNLASRMSRPEARYKYPAAYKYATNRLFCLDWVDVAPAELQGKKNGDLVLTETELLFISSEGWPEEKDPVAEVEILNIEDRRKWLKEVAYLTLDAPSGTQTYVVGQVAARELAVRISLLTDYPPRRSEVTLPELDAKVSFLLDPAAKEASVLVTKGKKNLKEHPERLRELYNEFARESGIPPAPEQLPPHWLG